MVTEIVWSVPGSSPTSLPPRFARFLRILCLSILPIYLSTDFCKFLSLFLYRTNTYGGAGGRIEKKETKLFSLFLGAFEKDQVLSDFKINAHFRP